MFEEELREGQRGRKTEMTQLRVFAMLEESNWKFDLS